MTARIVHHSIRDLISVDLRHMSVTGSADDLLELAAELRRAVREDAAARRRLEARPAPPIEALDV